MVGNGGPTRRREMTPIPSAISLALLHFAWQGLLVFVLLRITLFGMRRHSPNARYLASCVALAALAAAPLLTTYLLCGPHTASTAFAGGAVLTPPATERPAPLPPSSPPAAWFAPLEPW